MLCPICKIELKLADRLGIEIDYCPQCRGVWLDRGELDKLIERSVGGPYVENTDAPNNESYKGGHSGERNKQYQKKRGGFLGEVFDIFD